MSESESVKPEDITVDEQGRVVVTNPVLAEALRATLGREGGARRARMEPGINISSCGNNC